MDARQEILAKLKTSSGKSKFRKIPDLDSPIYPPLEKDLVQVFKTSLEQINGDARIFKTRQELFPALKDLIGKEGWSRVYCFEKAIAENLYAHNIDFKTDYPIPEDIEAGITGCEFLVARTGSAIVSSAAEGGRKMFVFPPVHIIIAFENQVVDSLETAYRNIVDKYGDKLPSMISVISGPSRTADIEKTLVLGAHGPKEIHIFVLKN